MFEWRSPLPHEKAVWWLAALISGYGWLVTCFPSAVVERLTGTIFELDQSPWVAFGTIDQATSVEAMISISSALLLLLVTVDFASEKTGRKVLALAVTVAGFITAVAGLCLHSSTELMSLWEVKHVPGFVFGLFWYHGNTAAFLNLSWPLGVWLCLLLLYQEPRTFRQQIMLSLLVVAVMVQIIAVFANVSKMGHLLLAMELLLLVGAGLYVWKPDWSALPIGMWRLLLLICIGLGLLAAGAWLSGAGDGVARWNIFATRHFDDPARRHAAMMALQIGWDHGWTGTGPGTFEWVAVHYSMLDPALRDGRWRHAHNDYTEFFAEWGWPGVCFFILLLMLPGKRLLGTLRQIFSSHHRAPMSFQRRTGQICCSVALVAVLVHALVDFPLQIDAIRHLFAVVLGMVLAMTSSSARIVSRRSMNKQREPVAWQSAG
ncbi:MAG: hypothetical protein B7Z37_17640 [Verrucomicrobia bacterium 12-59-8]|nr:MAG: hypothetical protein B7Z37_17640 [Verrucomicrobia bacterium 12-59-8]